MSAEGMPDSPCEVITIVCDRATGETTLDIGDVEPFAAWAMLLQAADCIADRLPTMRMAGDPEEAEADADDE